jgi:hypothetical protein
MGNRTPIIHRDGLKHSVVESETNLTIHNFNLIDKTEVNWHVDHTWMYENFVPVVTHQNETSNAT